MNEELRTIDEGTEVYARFRVGRGLALVSPPSFVLVDASNGAFGERLWSLMETQGGVDALLEELSATGLRSLGDFAMAQIEDAELRVVVRGQAHALIRSADGTVDLEAGSVKTWVEAVFDDATGFSLSLGEPQEEKLVFRMGRGVVPADRLDWTDLDDASIHLEGIELDWTDGYEPIDVGERRFPKPSHPDALSEPKRPPVAVQGPSGADDDPETSDVDDYDFDALYGRTVAKSVQDAAVAPVAEDDQAHRDAESPAPSGETAEEQTAVASDVTLAPGSAMSRGAALIDSIPTGTEDPSTEMRGRRAAPSEHQLGDHDGMTISVAQLREMRMESGRGEPAAGVAPPHGPAVQALVCPQGHPNPTHSESCLTCGEALRGVPTMVPRPVLGRLEFSSGRVVELDRPVIIGRSPKVQGSMPNEMPQLVALEGDDLLSRSHAMIRLESWHVLIEDLGSRNGTMVALPGRDSSRLMVGEPILLESGAVIEFSDDVSATYLGIA